MRKLYIAGALAAAIGLGACQPVMTGNPQVDAILAQAAAQAKAACGITVVAAQIVSLVPDPRIVTASAIANALCAAVLKSKKKGLLRGYGSSGTVQINIGGNVVNVQVAN